MFFFSSSFLGPFSFIFPLIIFFLGFRILRSLFSGRAYRRFEEDRRPYDDLIPDTRYTVDTSHDTHLETKIFRLANEKHGRLTVSDVVIGSEIGIKEAERILEGMVDGTHVTIDVTDAGRIVYDFPEIIARYEEEEGDGAGSPG